jgi:hypothetical protein
MLPKIEYPLNQYLNDGKIDLEKVAGGLNMINDHNLTRLLAYVLVQQQGEIEELKRRVSPDLLTEEMINSKIEKIMEERQPLTTLVTLDKKIYGTSDNPSFKEAVNELPKTGNPLEVKPTDDKKRPKKTPKKPGKAKK